MNIDFKSTLTEADFPRPLLDAAEERLAREARGDVERMASFVQASMH